MKYVATFFPIILGGFMGTALAQNPTFTFSAKEFQQRFNATAATDGGDRIVDLKKSKDIYKARLSDESFQKSVAEFKKLDLANGHFVMKTKIDLKTNREGKVEEITVSGDRADPMNLFQAFIGTMGVVIKVLDPDLSQDQVTKFAMELGLARGNDDPTTGTLITQFSKGGAYGCLTQKSYVSTQIKCAITPRS